MFCRKSSFVTPSIAYLTPKNTNQPHPSTRAPTLWVDLIRIWLICLRQVRTGASSFSSPVTTMSTSIRMSKLVKVVRRGHSPRAFKVRFVKVASFLRKVTPSARSCAKRRRPPVGSSLVSHCLAWWLFRHFWSTFVRIVKIRASNSSLKIRHKNKISSSWTRLSTKKTT